MREYGQIQCSFWSDPDIQGLSDDGKLLACYLMTGPHSNGLGCYRLPDGYVQADLGWSPQRVTKGFDELFRIGFSERCETTIFVLIPKFLRWNEISNANVAKARIKEFETIPKKSPLFSRLCESMQKHGKHWPKDFETILKGYIKQEPNQNQPREEPNRKDSGEPETVSPLPPSVPETLPVAVIHIPLIGDDGGYAVTEAEVAEWTAAFPAIDVMQSLRNIRQWNLTHRENRKTPKGIVKHIVAWLTKDQERAPVARPTKEAASSAVFDHNVHAAQEFLRRGTA